MTEGHHIRVYGVPIPQGSKTLRRGGGKVWMSDDNSHRLKAWRRTVATAWQAAEHPTVSGAAILGAQFLIPRPRSHYGTGRNAATVKPTAPRWVPVRPDLDKYVRAVSDALTDAGAWEDDARMVAVAAFKMYCDDPADAGAIVFVTPAEVV